MIAKLRKAGTLTGCCVLLGLTSCTTLSTDPLSPPHVRRASQRIQDGEESAENRLSPEYQEWLCHVRHCWGDTKREFAYEYHKNNDWPFPYDELAMQSVNQPLTMQAENARVQLLSIWDYHFEAGTGELNAMGHHRLENIVDQADSLGRVVYVRRTGNRAETNARVASVQTELSRLAHDQSPFEVVEASATPSLVSGGEAQKTMRLLTETKSSSASSSSGSSSGGSGGK